MTAELPKGEGLQPPSGDIGRFLFRGAGEEGGSAMLIAQIVARLNREDGQGMVEYALIIALVAIALVAALTALSGGLGAVFNSITHSL